MAPGHFVPISLENSRSLAWVQARLGSESILGRDQELERQAYRQHQNGKPAQDGPQGHAPRVSRRILSSVAWKATSGPEQTDPNRRPEYCPTRYGRSNWTMDQLKMLGIKVNQADASDADGSDRSTGENTPPRISP